MERAIGVFDSGLGGLTVVREIRELLPQENIIYLGDSKRVPYGPRPRKEIIDFSLEIVDFLMGKNVKALLVACNTISAQALDEIASHSKLPSLGVIKPGARAAFKKSSQGKISLIATEATVRSQAYLRELKALDKELELMAQPAPKLVELVEEGRLKSQETRKEIRGYLEEINQSQADSLILACTHFPALEDEIRKELREDIEIIDPARETVKDLRQLLIEKNLLNKSGKSGEISYYVSSEPEKFRETGEIILGRKIDRVKKISL